MNTKTIVANCTHFADNDNDDNRLQAISIKLDLDYIQEVRRLLISHEGLHSISFKSFCGLVDYDGFDYDVCFDETEIEKIEELQNLIDFKNLQFDQECVVYVYKDQIAIEFFGDVDFSCTLDRF
jgi:hypothetical protein